MPRILSVGGYREEPGDLPARATDATWQERTASPSGRLIDLGPTLEQATARARRAAEEWAPVVRRCGDSGDPACARLMAMARGTADHACRGLIDAGERMTHDERVAATGGRLGEGQGVVEFALLAWRDLVEEERGA